MHSFKCLIWRLGSMRSSYTNIKKDSKLTATPAGYCWWKCLMVTSSTGCCSRTYQKKLMYLQLHGIRQQSSVNKSARKKIVTSFFMFRYKGLKYTPYYYYKIFRTWSCHNGIKKKGFVLNNAFFMFISCYIYAICF